MTYALALLSALVYGVADFLGGLASRRASVPSVVLFSQAIGLGALLIVAPLASRGVSPPADLAWGAAAGFFGGIGVALLYYGLATGTASVVAPVTAVCSIVLPVATGLALGERPGALALWGIAFAALAVALLSAGGPAAPAGTPRPTARGGGVPVAIVAGILIGLFLVCLGRTREGSGMWPLVVARSVSSAGMFALAVLRRAPLVPPRPALYATVGAGILDVAANALYLLAVQAGSLGIVATLASLYPASTVTLARLVFRERLVTVQKIGLADGAARDRHDHLAPLINAPARSPRSARWSRSRSWPRR